ncbi:hypothetical protein M426DRAFT_65284 [Hypoxylon sp. CI-4A]|nr:hypothetical protein M426DRAFT_65284 [Hypoxylon sp. CI-4A]
MADATKKERIFITGASGYVGTSVTELAIAQGYEVVGLSRSEASDEKIKAMGGIPVRGDLTSLDVLRRESAAADIVIHLADPFDRDLSKGYDWVVEAQKKVADAFADSLQGTNKPLVTTSGALMAAPDPNGGETNEDSPRAQQLVIPRWKIEEYDISLAKKGIRVSSIRLAPYVYGRGSSGVKLFMLGAAKAGHATTVNGGKWSTSSVHVDDSASLYLLAAKKAPAGSVYNATEPTYTTSGELAQAIADALQVPVKDYTFEEASTKHGKFFAFFLSAQSRPSSAKARKELSWEIKRKADILEDIRSGSYVELAKKLRAGAAKN